MAIPESQLDTWSKQGSVTQSAQTYGTIKAALEDSSAAYAGRSFTIFLQGSYGNDTNVYADSDVDIVMCLDSTFYQDITNLNVEQAAAYKNSYSDATYGVEEFKTDVLSQLKKKFGSDVSPGKKAIDIKASGNRRNADVLVCAKFRRYNRFNSLLDEYYNEGICFFPSGGGRIENFPKQHSSNCTEKHQNTNGWFKPTVRIFKNLRNHMTKNNLFPYGHAPSYFLEGMLWNVPNNKFGGSYDSTIVNCVNWLRQEANRRELACANDLHYLLRNGSAVTWNEAQFDSFLSSASDLWNKW